MQRRVNSRFRARAHHLLYCGIVLTLWVAFSPFYRLNTSVVEIETGNRAALKLSLGRQNEIAPRLQQTPAIFEFCKNTLRCQSLPLKSTKFSYVHISKNSGMSWIREFKRLKQVPKELPKRVSAMAMNFSSVGLYPTAEDGVEHGVLFQDDLLKDHRPFERFVTIRSPRHQVFSMFRHLYFSSWGRSVGTKGTHFPRFHPDNITLDFDVWLDMFLDETKTHLMIPKSNIIRSYFPQNYQSRAMVSTSEKPRKPDGNITLDLEKVLKSYWSFDWVSVTAFFHESKCLLFYRLDTTGAPVEIVEMVQQYLETTCHCDNTQDENKYDHMDHKAAHGTKGKIPTMLDLPEHIIRKVDQLSEIDRAFYAVGLKQFITEIVWLEWRLQRRVLCDPILRKHEEELGYVENSVKALYYEKRHLAGLQF